MPFLDHLEELRWRILYSLLAIVVGTLVGWFVVQRVDVIGLLKAPIAPLVPGGRLMFTSPTEPFFITLKFAFALGLLVASPVVIYQAWAFLAPALYDRERRLIVHAHRQRRDDQAPLAFVERGRGVQVGVAARARRAVQLPAQRPRPHHHGGQLLRIRRADHDRVRARDRAAPRRGDPRGPRTRHAPVPGAQPALRPRVRRFRRGAADAARCGLHAAHDGAARAAVRSEHLVRLGGHAAPRAARPGGRATTQAHQMLTSYSSTSGTIMRSM